MDIADFYFVKTKKGARAHLFLHSSSTMLSQSIAVEHSKDKPAQGGVPILLSK